MKRFLLSIILLGGFTMLTHLTVAQTSTTKMDTTVSSTPGVDLFVREIRPSTGEATGVPFLLVHGGGPGGLVSFDSPVPGYSLAQDLADQGHTVYIMDVRGWAASTRPEVMNQPAENNPPAVSVEEAAQDIGAVVDYIREQNGVEKVALLGWASGGHWSAYYTTQHNEKVSHLMILNSLYGVNAPWELRENFADPENPEQYNPATGAYRLVDAEGLLSSWTRTIPSEDKTAWRDEHVAQTYVREALASDPTSGERNPPSIRVPLGYQLEAFNMSLGQKYWEASDIRVPTLVLRGELDFWSRPEDLEALDNELVNAPIKRTVTIPDGTHYLINDKPERGRQMLLNEVMSFVK
jgi:pimeloyl-ACP methyl ester carboxylesterase